jgi:NAD(P)-dependent dehydrogenase (short-subunit alcohol dehydrogenase family)
MSKVALVTGASRGIGKAIAVDLGQHGFDVAVLARTLNPGETRDHSLTVRATDSSPLPGSLSETTALIEASGQRALRLSADLLDNDSLRRAMAEVLSAWGPVDVVVHNGRYIGPGHADKFLDTPIEILERHLQANVIAPLVMNQVLIPPMIERGGGMIIDITAATAYGDPTKAAGEGGWGMGYGISKGAFHRVAGFLALELKDKGILCFNVQPGKVATERHLQDMAEDIGAPPEATAKVVTWLATHEEAAALNGTNIEAQWFCHQHQLLEGWGGPKPTGNAIRYDMSAAALIELEKQWETAG